MQTVLFFVLAVAPLSAGAESQLGCNARLPIAVMDIASATLMTELPGASFRVTADGFSGKVVSAQRNYDPKSVVLVVDVNSYITSSPASWSEEADLIRAVLSASHATHRFAMIAFANDGTKVVTFDQGRAGILRWLDSVNTNQATLDRSSTRTGLLDAIDQALHLLPKNNFGTAIVFVNNGREVSGHRSRRDLVQALLANGTRLFGFVTGGSSADELQQFTSPTGGLLVGYPDVIIYDVRLREDAVPSWSYFMARLVLGQILQPYEIDVQFTHVPSPDNKLRVGVVDPRNGRNRSGLYISFPAKITTCADAGNGKSSTTATNPGAPR